MSTNPDAPNGIDPAPPDGDFRPAGAVPGWIYCPAEARARKHPCADCDGCAFCADARCAVCLKRSAGCRSRDAAQPAVNSPPSAAP